MGAHFTQKSGGSPPTLLWSYGGFSKPLPVGLMPEGCGENNLLNKTGLRLAP